MNETIETIAIKIKSVDLVDFNVIKVVRKQNFGKLFKKIYFHTSQRKCFIFEA